MWMVTSWTSRKGLAIRGFNVLQICGEDVIRVAGGEALGKLAMMVGETSHLGFLSLERRIFTGTPYTGRLSGPQTVPTISA